MCRDWVMTVQAAAVARQEIETQRSAHSTSLAYLERSREQALAEARRVHLAELERQQEKIQSLESNLTQQAAEAAESQRQMDEATQDAQLSAQRILDLEQQLEKAEDEMQKLLEGHLDTPRRAAVGSSSSTTAPSSPEAACEPGNPAELASLRSDLEAEVQRLRSQLESSDQDGQRLLKEREVALKDLSAQLEALQLELKAARAVGEEERCLKEELQRQLDIQSQLGPSWELIRKVGEGGFGRVFEARGPLGSVALKISKAPNGLDSGLDKELAILSRLNHPNIIKAFGLEQQRFLVLELCGGNLDDLVELEVQRGDGIGAVEEWKAFSFFAQMFDAVVYLQRFNIVHRDLKTNNWLLAEGGASVKLCDFGSARQLTNDQPRCFEEGGSALGFRAPEVVMGHGAGLCADLWTLGCVFYDVLVGAHPFVGQFGSDQFGFDDEGSIPRILSRRILQGNYNLGGGFQHLSAEAKDSVQRLLIVDETQRWFANCGWST